MEQLKEQNIANKAERLELSENAQLKERAAKLRAINEAKDRGWVELTLDELNYDLEDVYQTVLKEFKKKVATREIGKEELALAQFLRSIRNDRVDVMKFLMNYEQAKLKNTSEEKKKDIPEAESVVLA